MRFARGLARIIFSLTFIVSGILKLIDPLGTGLIVEEYFSFMHLGFLSPASTVLGIALATIEFTIGITILIGLQMRFFIGLGLTFTALFTLLTLYLAIFNPISDCGCFGRAIHLTNWQSFLKNVVLLLLALLIFFGRFKATVLASPALQWIFVGLFVTVAIWVGTDALLNNPRIDFTAFSVGTDLGENSSSEEPLFETTFTYEKEGVRQHFTLDNLPDSTWTFVETTTRELASSDRYARTDFAPDSLNGSFFAISIYNPEDLSPKHWLLLRQFRDKAFQYGTAAAIYTPEGGSDLKQADRKALLTLNRSNGGVTYFQDGVITRKWARRNIGDINFEELLSMDAEDEIILRKSSDRIFIFSLLCIILLVLALIRLVCRIFISK